MEEEFVKYTEALALKELGFDEPCFYQYVRDFDNDGELIPIISETNHPILRDNNQVSLCSGGDCFAAPLKQQAFRWFRERYNIEVAVACFYSKRLNIPYEERQYHCHIIRDGVTSKGPKYKTYEEAELACLKKLIEIVKQK